MSLSLLFFSPSGYTSLRSCGGGEGAVGRGDAVGGKVASRLPLENCMDFSLVFEGSLYKNKTKTKL